MTTQRATEAIITYPKKKKVKAIMLLKPESFEKPRDAQGNYVTKNQELWKPKGI